MVTVNAKKGRNMKTATFCPDCGAPSDGGKFCANCGRPLPIADAPASTPQPHAVPQYSNPAPQPQANVQYGIPNSQPQYAAAPTVAPVIDSGSFGYAVLGFVLPIVGLILWLIWKDQKPRSANLAGKGALVSVIFSFVVTTLSFCMAMI